MAPSPQPAAQPLRAGLPPVVYHMAEAANWKSIRRGGLLCASALMDAAALRGRERTRLESECRLEHAVLPGGAQIRDQRPMPARALARCLVGMTPAEWYRLLNAHVFFWLDPARLNRQRAACAHRSQVVLVVDTELMIARHASRIVLSPINSGNARRLAAQRSRATLVPYAKWLKSRWASEATALRKPARAPSHRPIELAVAGVVPDVMAMVVDVVHLAPSAVFAADRSLDRRR